MTSGTEKKRVEYGSSDRAYKNMSKWNKNGTVYKMVTSREKKIFIRRRNEIFHITTLRKAVFAGGSCIKSNFLCTTVSNQIARTLHTALIEIKSSLGYPTHHWDYVHIG